METLTLVSAISAMLAAAGALFNGWMIAKLSGLRISVKWNTHSGDVEHGFRRSGTLVGAQRR